MCFCTGSGNGTDIGKDRGHVRDEFKKRCFFHKNHRFFFPKSWWIGYKKIATILDTGIGKCYNWFVIVLCNDEIITKENSWLVQGIRKN